jgi:two-component system, LuxR family, response regulator FixJ
MPTFLANRAVLVIDDDLSSFRGIARFSKERGYFPTSFRDAQEFLRWLADLAPISSQRMPTCCIVFDAQFVDVFQVGDVVRLFGNRPRICISRTSRPSLTFRSIKLGLFDFVEKPFRVAQLADTIDRALSHCETLVTRMSDLESIHGRQRLLTRREMEICRLLASGFSNKAIAYQLGISIKTLYVHRSNLLAKLGAKSTHDLTEAFKLSVPEDLLHGESGSHPAID